MKNSFHIRNDKPRDCCAWIGGNYPGVTAEFEPARSPTLVSLRGPERTGIQLKTVACAAKLRWGETAYTAPFANFDRRVKRKGRP